jgi:hypothetical protein
MLNQDIIRRLAHGDKETIEEVKNLPLPLQMAYGAAADELKRKEGIVPMSNGMEFYMQQKVNPVEREAVGNSLREMLNKMRENEEQQEKIRREIDEKRAKQMAERARALGSWA